MQLFIIVLLVLGCMLITYAIYLQSTKCNVCQTTHGYHKLNCSKNKMYSRKSILYIKRNHEVWITCVECLVCFDARHHGHTCPYCNTNNKYIK